jgi:hypothetical protein
MTPATCRHASWRCGISAPSSSLRTTPSGRSGETAAISTIPKAPSQPPNVVGPEAEERCGSVDLLSRPAAGISVSDAESSTIPAGASDALQPLVLTGNLFDVIGAATAVEAIWFDGVVNGSSMSGSWAEAFAFTDAGLTGSGTTQVVFQILMASPTGFEPVFWP